PRRCPLLLNTVQLSVVHPAGDQRCPVFVSPYRQIPPIRPKGQSPTAGFRIIDHPVTQWKELISPAFKGKAAILDVPNIGIMDAALAFESRGDIKYKNKGNMTREEIDKTINRA